jgi:hypothetical protein
MSKPGTARDKLVDEDEQGMSMNGEWLNILTNFAFKANYKQINKRPEGEIFGKYCTHEYDHNGPAYKPTDLLRDEVYKVGYYRNHGRPGIEDGT